MAKGSGGGGRPARTAYAGRVGGVENMRDEVDATDFGGVGVHLSGDREHRDAVYLALITTPEGLRGRGLASAALDRLTAIADRHRVSVWLQVARGTPKPGERTLTGPQLESWYKSRGWIQDVHDPGMLVRYPR